MKKYFVLLVIVIFPGLISCQTENDTIFVAFWNSQNLFDTIDDPKIDDEEFLPNSQLEWTDDRLDKKMFNLARVIRMMRRFFMDGLPWKKPAQRYIED